MSVHGLDPRLTFDQFVVAPGSRLAAAAAKRVAEAPGKAYNPLFIYGASGLGKTHLLMAIGNHAVRRQPDVRILCDTLARMIVNETLAELASRDAEHAGPAVLLLLDDAQSVAGDRRAQDALLSWWDAIVARGVQIVLAADRPPSEIGIMDQRLVSRLSSGLIADIGPPDYDMRVALARRWATERGHVLTPGVPEAIARIAFANVRELQGGLNRVIAAQELDGHPVSVEDVAALLGATPERGENEEFNSFFTEISGAVEEIATRVTPEQRLVDAIMRYEGEGFRTFRLEQGLRDVSSETAAQELVARFETDIDRLQRIAAQIRELDAEAPELLRTDLLRNPDRVLEAEALLAQVHARLEPLPGPGPGAGLDGVSLPESSPALRAARAVATQPASRLNPLLVTGPERAGKSLLLAALARQLKQAQPLLPVAWVTAGALAREAATALQRGTVEPWRAQYRRARVLVVDDIDDAGASGEVRAELAWLFETVHRSGGQIVLSAEGPVPADRADEDPLAAFLHRAAVRPLASTADAEGTRVDALDADSAAEPGPFDPWFLDREKVLKGWPYLEDLLVLEWE